MHDPSVKASLMSIEPADTLVVGLGNPILGDDGVGWRVVAEVERRLNGGRRTAADEPMAGGSPRPSAIRERPSPIAVSYLCLGGLSLMEHLIGYERAIIVDAVAGQEPVGSVAVTSLDAFPETAGHMASAHDATLQTALRLGRGLGVTLPQRIWVVGVVAERLNEFSERLSAPVEAAVIVAAQHVLALLDLEETDHGVA